LSSLLAESDFPGKVVKLDNGLTVVHQQIDATPVVVVDVWVQAGAVREPDTWSGMAHFLEHMIFKGTDRLPPGAFDREIENRGGMTNAATSHDYAHFFITTADRYIEDSLPLLADLLLHAGIPHDEFDREREVVLEEIRQSWDDPDFLAFQALMETLYVKHPYGRSVLGGIENLMERSPEQMRRFHRCYYQPENMVVAIVGNIERQRAIELVSQSFSDFPAAEPCWAVEVEAEPPLTEVRRRELYLPRLETGRLVMAWTGPGVEQLHDAYGLDLLSVLLAQGRTSRLVRELREERELVHAISSDFSLQRDSSLFTIGAWLEPQYMDRVEAAIGDRLCQLQQQPVSEIELNRAKRLLCNDYAFSTETPNQLAGLYGYYETIARAQWAVRYPEQIQSFDPYNLQRVASQYLSPKYYAVTTVKPFESTV
jgi:predicted Zn-dependent peptidase